jgi:uncharacterized membrane protein YphA (DoxX/SURF4 family)
MEQLQNLDLSSTSAFGATLLRFILVAFWIAHWWFKVGYRGMPATEAFFLQRGLPAWLAWFDIDLEVVIAICLILGIYVSFLCVISLPILLASMWIYRKNGFYFAGGGWTVDDTFDVVSAAPDDAETAVGFRRGWWLTSRDQLRSFGTQQTPGQPPLPVRRVRPALSAPSVRVR